MSTPKKGFDPLASLFDLPESPPARPDPEPVVEPEPPPAPPARAVALAGPDPAQLAKILAKAAAAKAAASAPKPPVAKAPPPKAAASVRPPIAKAKPPASLAERMAPPPKRALSAEEALAAARRDEDSANAADVAKRAQDAQKAAAAKAIYQQAKAAAPAPKAAPAPMREDQLGAMIAGIVGAAAPELGPIYIANSVMMDDRAVLAGLWRSHRARFAGNGDLDGAVACGAVLKALTVVPIGQLAAAHGVTDHSDWLIWVDLVSGVPVAAFRDARAWFGQG